MRDQNKGKTYNQVMNEWAAQKSFLKRASSSLMRPPMGAYGGGLLWGWLWRLLLMLLLPALLYIGWMRIHAKSGEFTTQLAAETKKFLGAADVKLSRTRWDWNGELRIEKIAAKSTPANFWTEFEATNVNAWIRVPAVFKKDWHLDVVDAYTASLRLRNGRTPATAAAGAASHEPALLTAGWGISPDFGRLAVDTYTCRALDLYWGSTPANAGEITGARAVMTRRGSDFDVVMEGGTAHQGWISNLKLNTLKLSISSSEARILSGDFTVPGGGSGSISGSVALGESPEIKAAVTMESVPFQEFLPDYLQNLFSAVCSGRVDLSGSTNRNTGVVLDAKLTVKSGSIRSIPVLRALEIITGEPRISQPSIVGGEMHFISQGASESGSIAIEGKDILLDCGALMKIGLNFRHERKPIMAENIKDAKPGAASTSVSTSATLRIGLAPEMAAKLNPAIRTDFGVREEQGLHWLTVPYAGEEAVATKSAADRLLQLHQGG